jgi:hypothetical protein
MLLVHYLLLVISLLVDLGTLLLRYNTIHRVCIIQDLLNASHTQHLATVEAQHRHRLYMQLEYMLMHGSVLALCLMLCACCWCYRCGTQRVGYVSVR